VAAGWGKHLSTLGRLGKAVLLSTLGRILPGSSTVVPIEPPVCAAAMPPLLSVEPADPICNVAAAQSLLNVRWSDS